MRDAASQPLKYIYSSIVFCNLELCCYRQLADGRGRIICKSYNSHIFRMVRDPLKVDGCPDLHVVAGGVFDRLTHRVLVCFLGPGHRIAEDVCVQRPTGVLVGLPEIGVPFLSMRRAQNQD
jgi:hypothetical protein